MKKKSRWLALLLVLGLIFSMTACSTGTKTSASGASPSTSGAVASAAATPKKGGTLSIAVNGAVTNAGYPMVGGLNPLWLSKPAIEMLARYDESGNIYGWLAKDIKTDPDKLTVTITLNEGIKYHDGSAFNAQAVCDVWQIYKDNGNKAYFSNVESATATSEYVVTVKLTKWSTSTVYNLCIQCGPMFSPTTFKKDGMQTMYTDIVGTGPFKMKSYDIAKGIDYVRNDNYWIKGEPYLDGISMIFYTDNNTGENIFRTGGAQFMFNLPSTMYSSIDRLTKDGFQKISRDSCISPTQNGIYFASGNDKDPISKLAVRQAFCYAIDKQALCDTFTYGLGFVSNQLAVPGSKEYNSEVVGYPYSVDKAKAKLKEAGYDKGQCTITFYYKPENEDLFVAVKGMLEAAGFNVVADTRTGSVSRNMYGTTDPWTCAAFFSAPTTIDTWNLFFGNPPVVYAINTIDMQKAGIFQCYDNCLTAKTTEDQKKYMMQLQKLATDDNCLYCMTYAVPAMINLSNGKVHDENSAKTWLAEWTPETTWLS
jgi:ABC-type transport system substrate-binding protein